MHIAFNILTLCAERNEKCSNHRTNKRELIQFYPAGIEIKQQQSNITDLFPLHCVLTANQPDMNTMHRMWQSKIANKQRMNLHLRSFSCFFSWIEHTSLAVVFIQFPLSLSIKLTSLHSTATSEIVRNKRNDCNNTKNYIFLSWVEFCSVCLRYNSDDRCIDKWKGEM